MNRTNSAQRWSDMISGSKEKQPPSLSQRVETMASIIELLLETLADLSDGELERFKVFLSSRRRYQVEPSPLYFYSPYSDIPLLLLEIANKQDIVFLMVQTFGHQSLEKTKAVLSEMKRTDLVQRLSLSGSGPKKKPSVDEHLSALIQKVAIMMATQELLLETLRDFSSEEQNNFKWLLQFTLFQRSLPQTWRQLQRENRVQVLVEICGQQSVEVAKEVFMDMNKTDLVQRLSETSSGPKAAGSSAEAFAVNITKEEKHSLEECWPALIPKVETMASVLELLLETLTSRDPWTVRRFKDALLSETNFIRRFPNIPLILLEITDMQDIVLLMVQTCGQQSVETIKEVLKKMNRTDLVQRLSHSSSGPKKKRSADKHPSTLIQRVATIAAVKELLSEILNDLSGEEIEKFKEFLQLIVSQKDLPDISSVFSYTADRAKIADQMVQTFGQQSVELTREVFMDMKRTDLVQRLAMPRSGFIEKRTVADHRPAQCETAATKAAVKNKLLETLKDLSYWELEKFKWFLQFTYFQKSLPQISLSLLDGADRANLLVDLIVENKQSVEVTKEVLMDMNRTDLVQWLSESSSGSKEKNLFEPLPKKVTMESVKMKLLETLEDLSYSELKRFKRVLLHSGMKKGHSRILKRRIEMAGRVEIMELMVEIYGQQSVEVIRKVLKKMNRRDLVQRLSNISLGSKGLSSLELEGCGSIMQDSSGWTKLEPKVKSTDADESPTYSLESEAGNFECSVSGLRWVCKEKVSFKYRFCSWGEPMERMESLSYMPAGPLIDITVIAGKLNEVFLPHWICIEDNPEICDKFAVLHISDCGDVVETVSEVTASHVKLPEPVFSPRAVLMKTGFFSLKINCKVLIYKTNTAFLTLHVFLIPSDPGLQQAMDKRESSLGYKVIQKPYPEKSLKMHDRFILTADVDGAEIYPEKLKLRYESRDPNFFEVFIENPDRNFMLTLTKENERLPVWTCAIRKDEYRSPGNIQGEHFVDKHQCDLIERVSNIGPILDKLLREGVIQQEDYDRIRAIPTTQDKMRELYRGPLKAAGHAGKEIFYQILVKEESYLVADLKRNES